MLEDAELLRRYARDGSENAFATLVERHVNFVYGCALRRVGGDAHLAQDVTQHVFTTLAREAAALARYEILSGWLYTTARNASAQVVRTERRRQQRESTALSMNELHTPTVHDAEWARLRPLLDTALDALSGDDRQAVLLRYFEGKSYADIGARLRLAENTARMRVERALEKLRAALAGRGVTSTTAGLALALANEAAFAAPAGLAASVTGAALSGAATATGGSVMALIGIGKLQAGVAAAVAITGAAAYVRQADANAELNREIAVMHEQRPVIAALRVENQQLATAAAEVALLRQDDVDLKQLAARTVEVKRARNEKVRVARARTEDRSKELREWLREQDRLAQEEVDRMNREGNGLIVDYKRFSAQAKDASLAAEVRANADAAAKAKLEEIQTKQATVKAYIEETRRMLAEKQAELRRLEGNDAGAPVPGAFTAKERNELEARAAEIEKRRRLRGADAPGEAFTPTTGTLSLGPKR